MGSLTTTSATLGHPTPSPSKESPKQPASSPSKESPKKKNIIKDIFGSDEEDVADIPQEEKDLEVSKGESDTESKERKEEKLSDVSDQDINNDDDDDAASRDLSVSPINSEQSESFEKAATLEGLDPEAISAEEDFTSLSESEDGEIKMMKRGSS